MWSVYLLWKTLRESVLKYMFLVYLCMMPVFFLSSIDADILQAAPKSSTSSQEKKLCNYKFKRKVSKLLTASEKGTVPSICGSPQPDLLQPSRRSSICVNQKIALCQTCRAFCVLPRVVYVIRLNRKVGNCKRKIKDWYASKKINSLYHNA